MQEALSVPWESLPKKTDSLFFALRVLEEFERKERRKSGQVSEADLPALLEMRDEMAKAQVGGLETRGLNLRL